MAKGKTGKTGRYYSEAVPHARDLGPLKLLPGEWTSKGTGWNMIALPFNDAPPPPDGFNYRLLMNQYDEELNFTFVDSGVPNRGLLHPEVDPQVFDQLVVTLDYQQKIKQVVAEDFPASEFAGDAGLDIHHEPGLWLYMRNLRTKDINVVESVELDVARLASIPHGNSLLALGASESVKGMPEIPKINGLPIGRFEDLDTCHYDFEEDDYLAPYKHYIKKPFFGNMTNAGGFPGFSTKDMNAILRHANANVKIAKTTILSVDTKRLGAGIVNIPFVVKEAEPVSMRSTFWIQELEEKDPDGNPKLRMQYSQVVMLNFFRPREDQLPGRATWPHISINTLEKTYKKRKTR